MRYGGFKNRSTWEAFSAAEKDHFEALLEYVRQEKNPTWDGFCMHAGLAGKTTPGYTKFDAKSVSRMELRRELQRIQYILMAY